MTRTTASLLAALTLLTAASCEAPSDSLTPTPADLIPERSLDSVALEAALRETGALHLEAPLGATRIGALMELREGAAGTPRLEARAVGGDGTPGPWRELETTWSEGSQRVAVLDLEALAFGAELRIAPEDVADVTLLTWSAAVPVPRADDDGELGASRNPLTAELAALGVVSRETWGARATQCSSGDATKTRLAVHHTVSNPSGDPAVRMRGLQAFHMDSRGWCDIGYHFLVSLDGRIWEGRPVHLLGAHVGNNNTGNIGVSFIGCFHTSDCSSLTPNVPPDAMIDGGADFIAGVTSLYGIAISSETVKGHRDHAGASTACPGNHLHARLNDLRSGSSAGPAWLATYVTQTFPLASQPFELAPNEVSAGYLEMRNEGSETWRPGEVFLGTTEPRDGGSAIAGPDWVSSSRAATIDREVPPGATGRFVFRVQAPLTPGDHAQFFNLVREGVSWFSESGGPVDDLIQIRVTTLDVPPVEPPDAGGGPVDAGPIPDDAGPELPPGRDAGPPPAAEDAGPHAPGVDGGPGRPLASGCGCRVSGRDRAGALPLLGVLALLLSRRRRRARG